MTAVPGDQLIEGRSGASSLLQESSPVASLRSSLSYLDILQSQVLHFPTLEFTLRLDPGPSAGFQVTFIGRSNVGKSSLLRAIFSEVKDLYVKISRLPGHTKTINFYGVGNVMCLVDVPGYGYAQPKHFVKSVETYLKTRKHLRRTFLLLDGKIGFQSVDEIAIEMLEEFKVPYCVVMTKIDKASLSRRMKNMIYLQQIQNKFMSNRCYPQPFLVSSMTGEGIAYLQAFLTYLVGDVTINERFQLKPAV